MLKKYPVLIGITIALALLFIATYNYPGGSAFDKTSIGFNWTKNYISNLFGEKAVNGAANTARFWAIGGMLFLSASFALFFIGFAKKIPSKGAAKVIRGFGAIGMVFTFLIATPLHDLMVIIASTVFLLSLFYITVFIFMSKLHLLKFLCTICLLIFYGTLFLYGSVNYRALLPTMQKATFISTIIVVLALEYFTKKEDFQHIKLGNKKAAKKD